MSASRLDAVYRSILITKFFTKGWGKPDNLRRLFEFRKIVSNREECYKLIPPDYPITITKEEKRSDYHLLEGHFLTPMEIVLPGVVPKCAHRAHFQVMMPANWADADYKPMCVHLAGTGDHYFWRRRNIMAKPLIKEAGIGAIILENPFYGLRKPEDQVRSSLHNVSDIFVMGGCLILETLVLLHWCERNGLGPLGVTGLSMGGHMASLAATNWPKPLVLVPCLSWSTASAVFTQGVMSNSINWDLLETQFFSDGEYRDKLAKMVTIIDEAFLAGRKFAQNFSSSSRSPSIDGNNFNLPALLDNNSNLNKKFDITNPNDLSSFKGLRPEESQNYYITKTQKISNDTIDNNNSLEILKENQKISDNLYNKITSDKKFELNSYEITELNELAFRSFESSKNIKSSENISENLTTCNDNKQNNDKLITSEIFSENSTVEKSCPTSSGKLDAIKNSDSPIGYELDIKQSSMLVAIKPKALQKLIQKNPKDKGNENEKNIFQGLTHNILNNIPFITKQKDVEVVKCRKREALQFMRGVMDECTHLGNFSIPVDTSLIIAVCAKNDAYVPRGDTGGLEECWPGAEIRYIDAGHVSAYVLHQSQFRSCIIEAFEKSKEKWFEDKANV